MKTAAEALRRISEKGVAFISRGDKSGTNVAELELWEKAGSSPLPLGTQSMKRGPKAIPRR